MLAEDPFDLDFHPLAAVRLDLLWFFNASPGEMGLRSSYPAMIRRLLTPGDRGSGTRRYEMEESVLDAAYRARRIGRVLDAAGTEVTEVLRACFSLPAPRQFKEFGVGAALVPKLQVTLDAYLLTRDEHQLDFEGWLVRLPRLAGRVPKAARAKTAIVAAADDAYWTAVRAFAGARRRAAIWR